jgi:DNA-binding CsgD family transcriptional regulator
MTDTTHFEVLSNLQLLQDLLSEQFDLFLVLTDQNANEITLPSKLPLSCYENTASDVQCKNCLAACVAKYQAAAGPSLFQCHRQLYFMIFRTNMQYFKPVYLVGGYTAQPGPLTAKLPLLQAIFNLPIKLSDDMTPVQHNKQAAIGNSYGLTQQELNILRYMVNGLTNQDIATKLFISLSTVKTHIAHILTKLKVSNRTEAAMLALQNGVWGQYENQ